MTTESERLAIEQALGNPSDEERAAIATRLANEPGFAAEVSAWQYRLAPLAELVPPTAPGEALWERIAARTVQATPGSVVSFEDALATRTQALQTRVQRWRWATAAAAALAASLALAVVLRPGAVQGPAGQQFVGVINASGELPPLLVSVDLARGEFSVQPVGLKPQAGKDYELWAVPANAKPISLGVVAKPDKRAIDARAQINWSDPALLLAVTVEPTGGSPTGQPTTPPVYTGKLIAAE